MKVGKVLQKGQIVIPKEIRDKIGMKVGNRVLIEEMRGAVLIMPEPEDPLKAMVGLLKDYRPKEPAWKVIRKMRDEDKKKEDEKSARLKK